ncbi:MAG: hypothetical protein Q9160_009371, partial [Pyrenula sp. 1 TL-2023]
YTVEDKTVLDCETTVPKAVGKPYIINSPNSDHNLGSAYVCAYNNSCIGNTGFERWDRSDCKGGPQGYCGSE